MNKFICNNCGVEIETGKLSSYNCPICGKGKMTIKKDWQEQEQIHQAVDDSEEDDNKTPKQDADEAIEEYFMERMAEAIARYGNEKIWNLIEKTIGNAKARLEYRKYFFKVGGVTPDGEEVKISTQK